MSIWGDFTSFFGKVGADFEKIFAKAPTFAQQAQSVITYVAPILLTILTFVDPVIEPAVAAAVSIAQADLTTVKTVTSAAQVTAGSTAAQSVEAALNSINSNISGILQMAAVKNSTKQAEITAAVNTITTEANALLTAIPKA